MNFKEKKEQIKEWVKDNKGVIILGLGTVAGVVITTIFVGKKIDEAKEADKIMALEEEFDPGRELDMQFVDPTTGEVLGTIGVMESYMNDMMDCQ